MSNVDFEDESRGTFAPVGSEETTKLESFFIKHGIVKDKKGAEIFFISISCICIIGAILLSIFILKPKTNFETTMPSDPQDQNRSTNFGPALPVNQN